MRVVGGLRNVRVDASQLGYLPGATLPNGYFSSAHPFFFSSAWCEVLAYTDELVYQSHSVPVGESALLVRGLVVQPTPRLAPLCAGVSPGMMLSGTLTLSAASLSGALVATSGSAMIPVDKYETSRLDFIVFCEESSSRRHRAACA